VTLIVNEICAYQGLNKTIVVAAADQLIMTPDGKQVRRKKLFEIPYLRGTVSYFGLAEVFPDGRRQDLSAWLPAFIREHSAIADFETFAMRLREALHGVVPEAALRNNPSGFHISGFNSHGLPDFWFLTNVGHFEEFQYRCLRARYGLPESHFLGRDAKNLGWDGRDPSSVRNSQLQTYRNGDIRAHVAVWNLLDRALTELTQLPGHPRFRRPTTPAEYGKWVKFKFEVIAYFYKKWATKQIVARPIDVCVLDKGFE